MIWRQCFSFVLASPPTSDAFSNSVTLRPPQYLGGALTVLAVVLLAPADRGATGEL